MKIWAQRYKKKSISPNNLIKIFDFCDFCDYLAVFIGDKIRNMQKLQIAFFQIRLLKILS